MFWNKSKQSKTSKRMVAVLSGFSPEEENLSLLYSNFNMSEVELVDVLCYFDEKNVDTDAWKKNIRNHLYELSLQCDELIVIGYSLGAVLAAHCCCLPFIKGTILISPEYKYMQLFSIGENYYDEKIEKCIRKRNINPLKFCSVFNNLVTSFNVEIKNCMSSVMLIQTIEEFEVEVFNILRSMRNLNSRNKTIICFDRTNKTILQDERIKGCMPFLIQDFLEKKQLSDN